MNYAPKLSLMVLYVADIDRSAAFYAALGFRFKREQHGNGPVHYSTTVGDTVLELYPASERSPVSTVRLGFAIASIEVVLEKWHRAGLEVDVKEESMTENGSSGKNVRQRILAVDPDCNKVELYLCQVD